MLDKLIEPEDEILSILKTVLNESKRLMMKSQGLLLFGFPRVMSLPRLNITGSIFLFGGALYSIWRFLRRREFAYRVWANILIAAGAGVLAFVGSRARLGNTTGLYPAEMVGAALMLAGFLVAGTLEKGRRAIRARRGGGSPGPTATE